MAASSLRSILGGEDVRRSTRQARRPVATPPSDHVVSMRRSGAPGGEGMPGSGVLEGAIRAHQTQTQARRRLAAVLQMAPDYLRVPKIDLFAAELGGGQQTVRGRYSPSRDLIQIAPTTSQQLGGYGQPLRSPTSGAARQLSKDAAQTVLHELVHASTPAIEQLPLPLVEGGAELLSRKIARDRMGFRAGTNHPYQPYVRGLRRRWGDDTGRAVRSLLTQVGAP